MKTIFSLLLLAMASDTYALDCDELAIGSSLRQDVDSESSITGLPQKFSLHRVSEDRYEVIVNPHIIGETREAEWAMKEKIAACLEEKSEAYSPKVGVIVKLKVYDPSIENSKLEKAPPMATISIGGKKLRANSGMYPIDIDCKAIVHETLHLTGLVDEYREVVNDRDLYSIRAIGPAKSIMSDMGIYLIFGLTTKAKLYPAHITHMTHPNCAEKNKTYVTCAKGAYRTEKHLEKPTECRKKSFLD